MQNISPAAGQKTAVFAAAARSAIDYNGIPSEIKRPVPNAEIRVVLDHFYGFNRFGPLNKNIASLIVRFSKSMVMRSTPSPKPP